MWGLTGLDAGLIAGVIFASGMASRSRRPHRSANDWQCPVCRHWFTGKTGKADWLAHRPCPWDSRETLEDGG